MRIVTTVDLKLETLDTRELIQIQEEITKIVESRKTNVRACTPHEVSLITDSHDGWIVAVKAVKNRLMCSLTEAKEIVDSARAARSREDTK